MAADYSFRGVSTGGILTGSVTLDDCDRHSLATDQVTHPSDRHDAEVQP